MSKKQPCGCEEKGDAQMAQKTTALRKRNSGVQAAARSRSRQITSTNGVPVSVATQVQMDTLATNAVVAENKLKALWESAKNKTHPAHKAGVDGLSAAVGVLSFEGLNAMVRWIGDKWAFVGENVDYFQSLPHLVLGIVAYWGELLTRKKPTKDGPPIFPSFTREVMSEWGKVFMLLGAANLFRALRVRRADAKKAAKEKTQTEAELARVKSELANVQAELAKFKK